MSGAVGATTMRVWEVNLQRDAKGRWHWSIAMEVGPHGAMSVMSDSPGSYATATLAAGFAEIERAALEARWSAEAVTERQVEAMLREALESAYGIEGSDDAGLAGAERRAWSASA